MNNSLEKTGDHLIETVGRLSSELGLNRVCGQLYALLFLSEKPLSLDDMVERLKISKGNASINIRNLERWEAVRKVWVKGSRKDFYEAERDISKIVIDRLSIGIRRRTDIFLENLKAIEKSFPSPEKANSKDRKKLNNYRKRFNELKHFCQLVNSFSKNIGS